MNLSKLFKNNKVPERNKGTPIQVVDYYTETEIEIIIRLSSPVEIDRPADRKETYSSTGELKKVETETEVYDVSGFL